MILSDLNKRLIKDAVAHGGDIEIYKANEGDWIARVHYGETHDGLSYVYLEGATVDVVLDTLMGVLREE